MKYAILFLIFLASCLDLSKRQLDGPYSIEQDPAAPFMTLYYTTPEDYVFERIRNVQKAGFATSFVLVQAEGRYYAINRAKDSPADIGSLTVREAISEGMNEADFQLFLQRNNLLEFKFQYSANTSSW